MKNKNNDTTLEWTLLRKTEPTKELEAILFPGEQVVAAYKTVRDVAALTTRRLIIIDKQGVTGKKVEIYSLPFRSIDMWSTENHGIGLDMTAELELWTRVGKIKISLHKNCNIREFDQILGASILK